MQEDQVYQAASTYASDLATLAIKGAVATSAAALSGETRRHSALAAVAAVAIERGGGNSAEESLDEGNPAWRRLQGALTRIIDGPVGPDTAHDAASRVIADVAIQKHAQEILSALDEPDRSKDMSLADRNVLEAVREDGGDVASLVRTRASGAYHQLTPDQQEDVAEAIATHAMTPPQLAREALRADAVLSQVLHRNQIDGVATEPGEPGRDALRREHQLGSGLGRPVNSAEIAVVAHQRQHPEDDERARIARAIALEVHSDDVETIPARIAVDIQRRATGREPDMLQRARLTAESAEVESQTQGRVRTIGIIAGRAAERG